MQGTRTIVNSSHIEILIAKMYIFLLPVRMISPLLGIADMLHGAAIYFDFILHFLGISMYLLHSRGKIYISNDKATRLTAVFAMTVVILNFLSVIMAVITQITQGDYAGESAFSGILGMEVYYFQYLFIILYNRRVFNILSEREIWKLLSRCSICLLILGYLQMGSLLFGGGIRAILASVDVFHILMPADNMWKLSLTGTEGASAGAIFGILVLPYLMSSLIVEKRKITYGIQIALWIPVLVMMHSTSAYFMAISVVVGYIYYLVPQNTAKKVLSLIFLSGILLFVFLLGNSLADQLPPEIRYLIFDKAMDWQNGSTVSRTVPLITNWEAFLEYPLIGVGNGLQGYYFLENTPAWALHVAGSDMNNFYQTAKTQIINGGLFFPSYLSGYGIIGLILLLHLFYRIKKSMVAMQGRFHTLFCLAVWPIIVCGFQGDFSGSYFIWFLISLPFIYYHHNDSTERKVP